MIRNKKLLKDRQEAEKLMAEGKLLSYSEVGGRYFGQFPQEEKKESLAFSFGKKSKKSKKEKKDNKESI